MNALRVRRSVRRPPAAENSGGWYRLAHSVMRRPLLYAVPIVVLLLSLGSPFLKVAWGGVDFDGAARQCRAAGGDRGAEPGLPRQPDRPDRGHRPVPGPGTDRAARGAELASYASRLREVPGVTGAQVTGVRGDAGRVDMRYGSGPYSSQARAIVGQVRDVAPPAGATAQIGGQTAALADELSSIGHTWRTSCRCRRCTGS